MTTIKELTDQLKKLSRDLESEAQQRNSIENSTEYLEIQKQIEQLQESQKQLTAHVCDSGELYNDIQAELIEEFKKQNIDSYGGVVAKYRKSNTVNVNRVLEALDGDLDNFILNAKITQVQLKEFAQSNPVYKKRLYDCIEEGEAKIVGFEIEDKPRPTDPPYNAAQAGADIIKQLPPRKEHGAKELGKLPWEGNGTF